MTQLAMPTGPVSADDPRAYAVPPLSLPQAAQLAMIERCLRDAAAAGHTRIGVYPAGRHSARLSPDLFQRCGVELVAVVDESKQGQLNGIEIISPQQVQSGDLCSIDAVLISSDASERGFADRARCWAGERPILRPYQPLERPGFDTSEARRTASVDRLRRECNGRLNLGCGSNPLPGWTNIDGGDGEWYGAPQHPDVIPLDVFAALAAIDNASCDVVYSEHFYEHFSLDDGFRMATEWARVLKPGAVVRVVTPDLTREARMYLGEQLPTDAKTYLTHKRRWLGVRHVAEVNRFLTPAMLLNFGMRLDGHQFVYDFETLRAQLESAGFESVTREKFGASSRPQLSGIDRHGGGETGGRWLEEIALVVEAVRKR